MFPPLSVSMCKHLLATRGKSLAEQFLLCQISRTYGVHVSSGTDDISSHSAKRRLFRREA